MALSGHGGEAPDETIVRLSGEQCRRRQEHEQRGPQSVRPRPLLDQRNLQFVPRVLAVEVGTVIDLPNNDRVFHNVFSFRDGKRFDLGLYPTGAKKQVVFDRPGVSRVFCNIHPQMAAYVVTVDSPYFGVSDERGAFTLQDVPAGKYEYRAWRAGGSPLSGSTVIEPGKRFDVGWP